MKLLYLTSRVPYPLDKGDKLRAYHQLKELSKSHEICLFSLNDTKLHPDAAQELGKLCSEIHIIPLSRFACFLNLVRAFFSSRPMQVGYFFNPSALRAFRECMNTFRPDHIFCQLIRTAEYAKGYEVPKTLDYMDVFSKGVERRISKVAFYLRPFFRMEYKRLLRYEAEVYGAFNSHIIISRQDRDWIPHPLREQIRVIPNGVDLEFFHHPENHQIKEFQIVFNGNMSYPPNIESALFLVKEIMPLVWQRYPETKVLISGTNPGSVISNLTSSRVTVSGWVPDVRVNLSNSLMLVAPMQSSIGLQNKLMEAMAMNLPCITSTLANNALGAKKGEEVLIADTPEEYAEAIFTLLENTALASEIAEKGYTFVRSHYNWQKAGEDLNLVLLHKL